MYITCQKMHAALKQQGLIQIYSHGKGSQLAGKVVKGMDVISTNKGGINIIYQGLT